MFVPAVVGNAREPNLISPVPLGTNSISPFADETILFPLTSKSPPSCGVVSTEISPAAAEAVGSNLLFDVDHCNTWFDEAPEVVICKSVPSPNAEYISLKLSFTLSPPTRRLSPVPSFGVVPRPIVCFAIFFFPMS